MLALVTRYRRQLLLAAAALTLTAVFLPLWGMTLVSTQYPDGLRMIVYARRIVGDIGELNALNHYVGMIPISDAFFAELTLLPPAFGIVAAACLAAAFARGRWVAALPLGLMLALAAYGFWSMQRRLYQFGHDLDPTAAIEIAPFTPPMAGENQIAQFATYAYFDWGTILPLAAGVLVALVLAADRTASRSRPPTPAAVRVLQTAL
jgi:copper chaperone NosL